ncbi:MAG: hypothetical protein ACYS18_04200 [Planctomycetota bacterium]|jgi:membrane protein implicated in regulation of membrane protease activity
MKIAPSFTVAIVHTFGALLFGLPAIVLGGAIVFTGKGSWLALAVFSLISACHASSAVFYWRRYMLGRRSKKLRKESAPSAI